MVTIFGLKLRPELDDWKYYLHLVVIAIVAEFLLNQFVTPMQITVATTLISAAIIGVADVIAHTLLQID